MVKFIIAKQLVGKKVVTNDGFDLGKFVDADVSKLTGKITAILVEPDPDSSVASKMAGDEENIKVNFDAVMAVNDYIVVDRKNL